MLRYIKYLTRIEEKDMIKREEKSNFKRWMILAFCIVLGYCFLLVGSPLDNNTQIINVALNIIMLIVIYKNFKENQALTFSKMEICLLILIISQGIPILFGTQATLTSTVNAILKYITVWNVFIIVKYILKLDETYKTYIINTIIIISIILIVFGIDMMHENVFQKIYTFLDTIVVSNSSEIRMDSLYEYPNTFAMFLGIAIVLSIGQIVDIINTKEHPIFQNNRQITKEEKRIILYILAICFNIYGIIMAGSRLTMLILFLVIVLWSIIERKKVFKKKIIVFLLSFILIIGILIVALCFWNTKLVLFDETKEEQTQYIKQINHIQPNTEYHFDFDISAINNTQEEEKFKIIVREMTNTAKKIDETVIEFGTFEGTKSIDITTKEKTNIIRICFVSRRNIKDQTRLEVNRVSVNGKTIRVNYGFIPITVMNRLTNIGLNASSVTERFVIIKDGIRLGLEKFFTGFGNDGWRYNYKTVREYHYGATQMHCYIVDIFIQSGIVGLMSIAILFVLLTIKMIKLLLQKQKAYYSIVFATIFGVLHTMLDFDMNFYAITILIFMFIAIIDSRIEEKKITIKPSKIVRGMGLIIMIMILVINTGTYIAYIIDKQGEKNQLTYGNWKEKLTEANVKIALAPYDYNYISEKIQIYTIAKNSSHIKIDEATKQKYTEKLIKMLKKVIKQEQGKDMTENYRRLISNYIDTMNPDNVEDILNKVDELIDIIKDDAYIISTYEDIVYQLESKYETLHDEKIQKKIDSFNEIIVHLEEKMREEEEKEYDEMIM